MQYGLFTFRLLPFVPLFLSSCSLSLKPRPDTLYLNIRSQVMNLDPLYARNQHLVWLTQQLFQTLFTIDTNGNLIPSFARDYVYDPVKKRVTIHLPKQVPLPPNPYQKVLTIHDVVFTLTRLADPEWASPGSWILLNYVIGADSFYQRATNEIRGIKAIDDTTLQIWLKKPFPYFPYLLTLAYTAVVPKQAVLALGKEFGKMPVGSGIFQIKKWVVNRRLILEKNPTHQKPLSFRYISIDFVQDAFSEVIAFLQGSYDLLFSIEPDYLPLLRQKMGQKSFALLPLPELGVEYVAAHTEKVPLLVRKALSCAIDRETLCRYVREGKDLPAIAGLIPTPLIPDSVNLTPLVYDPTKATEWLRKTKPSQCTLYCSPNRQTLAAYLQGAWEKVGLTVVIEVLESQTSRMKAHKGELSLWLASWLADYPHSENFWMLFLSENLPPHGPNLTRFSHPTYDSLYYRFLEKGSRECYSQLDSVWKVHLPAIPLFFYQQWIAVGPRIRKLPKISNTLVLPLHEVELVLTPQAEKSIL
jgi:peptide/nickel transport system substrate-binding protein